MKKVVHINLGGKEFTINEDAYHAMETYLKRIEKHFHKSKGFEGIIYDIECRMGELFDEDKSNGNIVTMEKLEKIKNIMGRPSDFSEEPEPQSKKKRSSTTKIKTGKKLFRDTERQMVSGVAAGLSSYFGISDPILIRLLFVLFSISGGLGMFTYIILWIVVPKAKTTSDYLEMKGEEVNIDNIAKSVEDSLKDIKNKIEDISKGFKTKIL